MLDGLQAHARLYLQPIGLVRDANGPSNDDGVSFSAMRVFARVDDLIEEHTLTLDALLRGAEAAPTPIRAQIDAWLAALGAKRPVLPGLPPFTGVPLLMGIVNVTPDSFADGGRYVEPQDAIAHGLRLRDEGAHILDVGGESTRPGAAPVSADEEQTRVVPVVRNLAQAGCVVSIDTRHAATMRAALDAGAAIINDVSALSHDAQSLDVAAASGVPVVLMHMLREPQTMQQAPSYDHALLDVYDHLHTRIEACVAAGIDRARLIVDPGIGFGKTMEHNATLLRGLETLHGLSVPLLLGASRKSFIGKMSNGEPVEARLPGSLAAALRGAQAGCHILRVHDVAATVQALNVWRRSWP